MVPTRKTHPCPKERLYGSRITSWCTRCSRCWYRRNRRRGSQRRELRQSRRAAARPNQHDHQSVELHRPGPAEPRARLAVSGRIFATADRRRRHADVLGILQQRATPHSERRLGQAGHPSRFPDRGGDFRRQYAAHSRRHPRTALASGCRVGLRHQRGGARHHHRRRGARQRRRHRRGRTLVFPLRLAALVARDWRRRC